VKRVWQILNVLVTGTLIVVIMASAALAISARRSKDAIPSVLGHKVLTVLSGSMAPAIRTGDVIVDEPLAIGDEVRVGDVVTFRSREKTDMLITHRVVEIVKVDGRVLAYKTKGDANKDADTVLVGLEQLVGRYQWRIPFFGYISTFLRTPIGILLFVILPGLALIGLELRRVWVIFTESERKAEVEKAQDPEA
jgi:signal peptidase